CSTSTPASRRSWSTRSPNAFRASASEHFRRKRNRECCGKDDCERRRARRLLDLQSSQCGTVTFVQRFGDALNANPHFHCLVLDGVYAAGENGRPAFHQLPAPENEDVLRLTTTVAQRVQSLLQRRGLAGEAEGFLFFSAIKCPISP